MQSLARYIPEELEELGGRVSRAMLEEMRWKDNGDAAPRNDEASTDDHLISRCPRPNHVDRPLPITTEL